ncbi:protein transport protein HofC [Duffyella gerundensis]|uniref:protein transport protein HofC n=1 Tax=Duffyella gerundensis TaxID=1619313 RepID=UPI003FD5F9DE
MADCVLFRWQAMDDNGALHQGEMLAADRQQAVMRLIEKDLLPIGCRQQKRYRAAQWKGDQKINFIRQLATLLQAGMTLADALRLIGEGHPHAGWRALIAALQEQVSRGDPFSTALQQWPTIFSPLFPALMQVGEVTGQLDSCCQQLAGQQERQQQLQKKVIKALRYPLFILLVAGAVSGGMLLFVLPEFVAIYDSFDSPLPAFTAAVMGLSEWLQSAFLPLAASMSALLLVWRRQRQRFVSVRRREQRLLLWLPLISSLYRGSQLSRIFTTLSLTQSAGLTLLQSLQAVEKTLDQAIWREEIVAIQQHISGGMPLHQAIQGSLFTPLCYQLIKSGEEAGALDTLLTRLAEWHETSTHEQADKLAATLEPLMMVVIGVIVGVLVIAMYLPIFGLGDALH